MAAWIRYTEVAGVTEHRMAKNPVTDGLERLAYGEPQEVDAETLSYMASVCLSALHLSVYDRELTEAIVGDHMDGSNWSTWGGFDHSATALYQVMKASPLPEPSPDRPIPPIEHGGAEMEREQTYSEYLASEEWQTRRKAALQRAGRRCQLCGASEGAALHVHHNTYARVGAEQPGDLIVLCSDCHGTFHRERELSERIAQRAAWEAEAASQRAVWEAERQALERKRWLLLRTALLALRLSPDGLRYDEWVQRVEYYGEGNKQMLNCTVIGNKSGICKGTAGHAGTVERFTAIENGRRVVRYRLSEAGRVMAERLYKKRFQTGGDLT